MPLSLPANAEAMAAWRTENNAETRRSRRRVLGFCNLDLKAIKITSRGGRGGAGEWRLAGTASPNLLFAIVLAGLNEVLRSGHQGGAQPSRQAASHERRLVPGGDLQSMRAFCICGVSARSKSAITISAQIRKSDIAFAPSCPPHPRRLSDFRHQLLLFRCFGRVPSMCSCR